MASTILFVFLGLLNQRDWERLAIGKPCGSLDDIHWTSSCRPSWRNEPSGSVKGQNFLIK
jgi:hypothetical protein